MLAFDDFSQTNRANMGEWKERRDLWKEVTAPSLLTRDTFFIQLLYLLLFYQHRKEKASTIKMGNLWPG